MRAASLVGLLGSLLLSAPTFAGEMRIPDPLEKGNVRFVPLDGQKSIPVRYRLDTHTFDFELSKRLDLPNDDFDVHHLQFPSALETDTVQNNTVHGEYYRPHGDGPFPGVVVLDILGGDGTVPRMVATSLAQKHIAALAIRMPYYGERRPEGSRLRMISIDFDHSMESVRQTVLDVRRAAAWLESRKEIDAKRIGITGTSLGSFMGSLSAEMEPRLGRVALLLGGGGLVDGFYDNPRAEMFRKSWEALGGTKDSLTKLLAPADPLTYADHLRERKVLMIAGKRDEIVPPKMTEALWKASGQQKIVWYDCTHHGAVKYIVPAMGHVVKHFGAE
jgi:dienelactone hydrolase